MKQNLTVILKNIFHLNKKYMKLNLKDLIIGKTIIFKKYNTIREGKIIQSNRNSEYDKLYPDYINLIPKIIVDCRDNKKQYRIERRDEILKII